MELAEAVVLIEGCVIAAIDQTTLRDLEFVLHEAQLSTLFFDEAAATLQVTMLCVPFESDTGTPVPPVAVTFGGVTAFATSVEPLNARPSSARWPSAEKILHELAAGVVESEHSLYFKHNDPGTETDVLSAPGLDWRVGSRDEFAASSARIVVAVEGFSIDGIATEYSLIFSADWLRVVARGRELTLGEWVEEAAKWWSEPWPPQGASEEMALDSGGVEDGDGVNAREYEVPPGEIVQIDSHRIPKLVYRAVVDWFEYQHAGCNDRLEVDVLYGYPFARAVDSWWAEEARATVVVRGIQYHPAIGEEAAESTEAVWTLGLRRRGGDWFVVRLWDMDFPRWNQSADGSTKG